ncbi:MAG: hypothetical protein Q8O54_05310 [Brevundimonas sp.]|nr:hypothetical protein [Brevundimonas sp.]
MRGTVFALLAVTALVAGCERPAETAADQPAAAAGPVAAPPVMPADAPPQEEVDPALVVTPAGAPVSCLNDIGAEAAQRLVDRCIAVSPATRPPCNVANPCEMIQGEIDRSCDMYAPGETRPEACAA